MTIMEAVKKFEQLARLCPELVPSEIEKDKEARAQNFKAKKEENAMFGRNKRNGNVTGQGQQRNYPQKKNNRGNEGNNTDYPVCANYGRKHLANQNPPYPSRNANSQLHAVQARIEGPSIAQGRLEAPEPQARIYAYTKGDAEAGTSHVVSGQISIATYDAIAIFDSGATHSFV
ncbi:hypothetical protein TIFTF001_011977 [Ficus carica]|uniref:Uncharacterized protein n=1 Tax=Ficus carica TaxID=3494 RepID=A0AA88D4U7_FICCA|nr:hypothetical protein TIFTF001_011977 [Ficus carica]